MVEYIPREYKGSLYKQRVQRKQIANGLLAALAVMVVAIVLLRVHNDTDIRWGRRRRGGRRRIQVQQERKSVQA